MLSQINFLHGSPYAWMVLAGGLLLVFVILITGINYSLDIYGIARSVKGRKLKVYYNEKITKYFFSFRYIPQNFNTVILGTSLSDSLDVSEYNKKSQKNKVYNGSIMGANIGLLYPMVENVVRGGVKNIIICLSPYMMKNSKGISLPKPSPMRVYVAGTKFLFQAYLVALIRFLGLMPKKFPANQFNEFGVHHYYNLFKIIDINEKFRQVIDDNKDKPIVKDPGAYQYLKTLIDFLNYNEVNYFIYFHPLPVEIFESKKTEYDNFHQRVRNIVGNDEIILDLNEKSYAFITSDYSNYLDHGHLSAKGQKVVTDILCKKLDEQLQVGKLMKTA